MSIESHSAPRLYNPAWLSDDELVAGFTARLEMLKFLCGELERAPLRGTTHHYLLVGVRGSGKTSMLKRIAIAIRRESRLSDHLIGLSFPEELYEVKGLSDFWWASCRALVDALDNGQFGRIADDLAKKVEEQQECAPSPDPHDDAGLRLMLDVCNQVKRRPVLLVDNLDLVLKRIDKSGRKLKDRKSPAYWALREILSTATAPIVVGGSVRLSTPFLGHDDAFYDYFVAQRLIKLSLDEVRNVFDHLARNHGDESLRERIRKRPGRLRALYEMTGGNPRALGLVFELLRRGPNSSAIEAFEQLLDLTTPYYKARFEEIPEQAQVVLHALALSRRDITKTSYGHRAVVVARRAGLDTRIVSAQLEMMINEGLVEKNRALGGRTQYRVAEQLFRLWLQMRSTRRMRQQVICLAEFLEALFDRNEHRELIRRDTAEPHSSSLGGRARLMLALSELEDEASLRYDLETRAADAILEAGALDISLIEGKVAPGDLSEGIEFDARSELQKCAPWHKTIRPDTERLTRMLLGSLQMSREEKLSAIGKLCSRQEAGGEFTRLIPLLEEERQLLLSAFSDAEIDLLYRERASGRLTLPFVLPGDLEFASEAVKSLTWKLLRNELVTCESDKTAEDWISWGKKNFHDAESSDWAAIARAMRRQGYLAMAHTALDSALLNGASPKAWYQLALLNKLQKNWSGAEHALRSTIELEPTSGPLWSYLGDMLHEQDRDIEAESAYRRALQLNATHERSWSKLGELLTKRKSYDSAEVTFRKAIELAPNSARLWRGLGRLLERSRRYDEAESAYRNGIQYEPSRDFNWILLGALYQTRSKFTEAEDAFRKALAIQSSDLGWRRLGAVLNDLSRHEEAEAAYKEAINCNPNDELTWMMLGELFWTRSRHEEAESAFRRATQVAPTTHVTWILYGGWLSRSKKYMQAEDAYRRATELQPGEPTPWIRLGSVLRQQSKFDQAASAYRKAIELDPLSVDASIALGKLLARELRRFDEAMTVFSKALQLNPADSKIRATQATLQIAHILSGLGDSHSNASWEQVRSGFLALMTKEQEPITWLTDQFFLGEVVRGALKRGDGPKLLSILQETRIDTIALPLVLALDAAIEGNEEKLASVEPEARAAAQLIFELLTEDPA